MIYITDKKEAPLYLFNRLLVGVKIDGDIEFYLKKAYSLEKEQLYDFFEGIKSKDLKYRFMIDFFVLLGSNNLKKENLTIVTEFCDDRNNINTKLQMDCLKKGYELKDTVTTVLYGMHCAEGDNSLVKQVLPKEKGNIFAEYVLGIAAINGYYGGKRDYYLGVKHFIKAHGMGFYRASYGVFLRYKNGEGVFTKDWVQVSLWAEEVLNWGIEYKGFDIAYMYMNIDEYGCSDSNIQNDFYKKAIVLWKRLIDLGYTIAATNLGWMYDNGRGVEKSDSEAFKYYKIAADGGSDTGQYNLAWDYEHGCGTEIDINKAIFWYKKSAEQGYKSAKNALERLGIR